MILIGHSMGGLVIKKVCSLCSTGYWCFNRQKAYILARQEAGSNSIAEHIKALFFLATPHRGSDSAALLNNILRASGATTRPYVTDLGRGSLNLQVINDEFKHYTDDVSLWSFFETVKTNIGVGTTLIVDKESATLGYKTEHVQLLNTDHRHMCKFDSPTDSNFVTVRNSLVTAMEETLGDVVALKSDERKNQMKNIQLYLDKPESPEDELANLHELKVEGSCTWFDQKPAFENWRDGDMEQLQIYWLSARAASGKSVTAAHVVEHLLSSGLDCSYHFFKYGITSRQTIAAMLRSIAFQMADLSSQVRHTLSKMQLENVVFDKEDERAIFRKLFASGIFRTQLHRCQYWVLDGLDECTNAAKLFPLLAKLELAFPLRIFMTCRPSPEFDKHFSPTSLPRIFDQLDPGNTDKDILIFLNSASVHFPVDDADERERLIEKLLNKANGCFLWVKLVLQELERVYSDDQINEVIDEMPEGMSALYDRALKTMSGNVREKKLIHALLTWAVIATRPLKIAELQTALKLDLGVNIRNVQHSVEALCGQLLYVNQSGTIEMIHTTAREFLLDKDLESEFAVTREMGHLRLAFSCLTYLNGDELKPPRNRVLQSASRPTARSPFAEYAVEAFSYHVASGTTSDDKLLVQLARFLSTNILSWVELLASRRRSLNVLIRTAKNFKRYLERRSKHIALLGKEVQIVEGWSTDLIRLATKFGRNLIAYPRSIHFMIPPFCPPGSIIYQQFAKSHNGIIVSGLSNTAWDDCVSYIEYSHSWATSLACGISHFAIGFKSGKVFLHDQSTCQEQLSFQHPEPVKLLEFDSQDRRVLSAGPKHIAMSSIGGELVWKRKLPYGVIEAAFSSGDDLVVAATRGNEILRLNAGTGEDMEKPFNIAKARGPERITQSPLAATISPDLTVVAMVYRGRPLQLWSLETDSFLGFCGDAYENGRPSISAETALFNPNSEAGLLAVIYQDGQLTLHDTWTQQELQSVPGDALTLASTPDGRTLATGNAIGVVQIWDFETLRLMYQINSSDYAVKSLAFSGDGLRLVDIRDTKTKVWEPSVFVRKSANEEASVSEAVGLPPTIRGVNDTVIEITALYAHPTLPLVFVGKEDGSVSSYDSENGALVGSLYQHGDRISVNHISYSASSRIASSDTSGQVLVYLLSQDAHNQIIVVGLLLKLHGQQVNRVLLSHAGDRLFCSTETKDVFFAVGDESSVVSRHMSSPLTPEPLYTISDPSQPRMQWAQPNTSSQQLFCYHQSTLTHQYWHDLGRQYKTLHLQSTEQNASSEHSEAVIVHEMSVVSNATTEIVIIEYGSISIDQTTHSIACWSLNQRRATLPSIPTSPIATTSVSLPPPKSMSPRTGSNNMPIPSRQTSNDSPVPIIDESIKPDLKISKDKILYYLGMTSSNLLLYLNHDFWLCSVKLPSATTSEAHSRSRSFGDIGSGHANAALRAQPSLSGPSSTSNDQRDKQHFFIPRDYVDRNGAIICVVTKDDYLAFAKEGEVVIVRGSLD